MEKQLSDTTLYVSEGWRYEGSILTMKKRRASYRKNTLLDEHAVWIANSIVLCKKEQKKK